MPMDTAWLMLTLALLVGAVSSIAGWFAATTARPGARLHRGFYLGIGIILLVVTSILSTITLLR